MSLLGAVYSASTRVIGHGVARAAFLALSAGLLVPAGLGIAPVHADDSESDWDSVIMLEPRSGPRPRLKRHRAVRRRAKQPISAYRARERTWHEERDADFALHQGHAFPPLVVRVVGEPDPVVLKVLGERGGFDESSQALATQAFGGWEGGPGVCARLLDLLYLATRHFNVPSCHLVSGLRPDHNASRHSHGMAADVVLPGVKDADLAAFFRAQGFTGVGTYPRSGFVHVDVRESSYYWVDRSPPGKRWRMVQVRAEEARASDEAALARGVVPEPDPDDLKHALARRAERKHARPRGRAPRGRGQKPPRNRKKKAV